MCGICVEYLQMTNYNVAMSQVYHSVTTLIIKRLKKQRKRCLNNVVRTSCKKNEDPLVNLNSTNTAWMSESHYTDGSLNFYSVSFLFVMSVFFSLTNLTSSLVLFNGLVERINKHLIRTFFLLCCVFFFLLSFLL